MEKLVLIDGNSLINRAFYAMPVLTTKIGTPTNAVYGFMNMFFKMLSDIKPTKVAVAFDVKAPTFRHKLFADYKGTRKPMPAELVPQIPLLKEVLKLMGVCILEKAGIEADDIIGTIAKHTDIETIIITGDKDSFQLVDEYTTVYFTKRGITDTEIYSNENFFEKTSITPPQIIELKALMGDSSDNIPGVPGVGEKTAINLLQLYKDLDGVYQNLVSIKGKLNEKLTLNKDSAYLSKTLATINSDCDIEYTLSSMKINLPFSKEVREKFVELEFKSLFNKQEWFSSDGEVSSSNALKEITPIKVDNLSIIDSLIKEELLSFVLTDNGAFISNGKAEYHLAIRQTLFDDGFDLSQILLAFKPMFLGKNRLIVFSKKDLKHYLFATASLTLSCPTEDISIMKYLADFSGKTEDVLLLLTEYNLPTSTPAYSLFNLYAILSEKLKEQQVEKLYYDIELPLADVLYDMEQAGFKVEVNSLNLASEKYRVLLEELEQEIRLLCEEPNLNVNSPKQLGEVLFDKLKLGKGKKTKHGYSTQAEILESLENTHPIIPKILKYRQLQKIQSTYIEGFKPLIDKTTGLVHTSFNQTVTATGRLSSKEPNLQNIPVRDDEGKEIRKFFVAKDDDRILVSADYSQIELRLLAAFSKCQSLIDAFCLNKDIHSATASKVFNTPLEKVTPTMRSNAKAVNFGIIYGISEYGLAKTLKIEPAQARNYINSYFVEYPEVKEYMDNNVDFAKKTGYAITHFGRKRYIRELLSPNFNMRAFGERVAMNMPLQGSSADIIKLAMLGVAKRLKDENLKSELILQIHDELIVDTLKNEKEQVEKILVEEMEGAVKLAVPLTVSLGSGKTWFDAK